MDRLTGSPNIYCRRMSVPTHCYTLRVCASVAKSSAVMVRSQCGQGGGPARAAREKATSNVESNAAFLKNSPVLWTPTCKISALRKPHPLVLRLTDYACSPTFSSGCDFMKALLSSGTWPT